MLSKLLVEERETPFQMYLIKLESEQNRADTDLDTDTEQITE